MYLRHEITKMPQIRQHYIYRHTENGKVKSENGKLKAKESPQKAHRSPIVIP